LLETLSEIFYDPLVFWGVPLLLALLKEAAQAAGRRRGQGDKGRP